MFHSFLGCFILFHVRRLLSSVYGQLAVVALLIYIYSRYLLTLVLETMATSTADAIGQALETTMTFLEKNQKLDAKVYQSMEDNQILALVKMLSAQSVEAEQGMKWSERCLSSNLSDQNKAQLSQAISMAMCKSKQTTKRAPQTLHAGFLNYLTMADRRQLSDESQHIFSRCSVAVRRCMAMGLVLPCERSAGHIVATLVDHFGMGQASAQSKHELLLDFKRQLKACRGSAPVELQQYPSDPRELQPSVINKIYIKDEWEALPKAETACYRPGKWLRGSSRELGGNRAPADTGMAPGMQQAQQALMLLQNMMLMNGGSTGTGGQDLLNNLILFPNSKRRRTSGQQAIGNETVAGQTAAATGGQGCREVPALQDIQETTAPENVRKDDGSANPFVPPDVPENDTPGDHAKKMLEAFEQRKAANTPVMKKPSAKAAAKPKAKAKSAAKAKAKGAPKAKSAPIPVKKGKKPPMMAKGDPTCFYRQGKIHRSDTSQCWRVFRNVSDRCDLKVKWHNDMQNAWNKALKIIDDHASQG